jgi:hypothetical protein
LAHSVSPEEPEGTELVLEPDNNPTVPTRAFKKAIKDNGIPFTAFEVDDHQKEYKRMKKLGVKFTQEPIDMGPITARCSTIHAATSYSSSRSNKIFIPL